MAEGQLLLWGETQVGKTTLLASGLLAEPDQLPPIRWDASPDPVSETIIRHWGCLRRNQLIGATSTTTTLRLQLGNGNSLAIHDIRGGSTRNPFGETFGPLTDAQGILFVTEWEGRDIAHHMAAIEGALRLVHRQKIGLAITKCEKGLDAYDPHWRAPPGWWREHACWRPYVDVLRRFDRQVWPTSAYGFDPDGRPACLLGEFGQLMPYQVNPRNVATPFAWFCKQLELWQ